MTFSDAVFLGALRVSRFSTIFILETRFMTSSLLSFTLIPFLKGLLFIIPF